MQSQRTILWIVFTMSLVFLFDNWQKSQGQPSMLGTLLGGPASQGSGSAAKPATKPAESAPKADPSIPPATSSAVPGSASVSTTGTGTAPAVPASAAANPVAASTQVLVLANDMLKLSIDSNGGQVKKAELLQHKDLEKKDANVFLLDERTGYTYLAQTGFIGATAAAAGVPENQQSFPTHRTAFSVVQEPRAEGDVVTMKLAAEGAGLRVVRTYSLAKGTYLLSFKDELSNTGTLPLKPILYMQLVRDSNKLAGESQFYSTFTGPVVYSEEKKFQKVDFVDIEKNKADHVKTASD